MSIRSTGTTAAAPLTKAGTTAVALLATASLGITATAAYAAWSVSGSATTTARAASVTALGVTVSAPTGLFPGATRAVTITVTNTNEFPVKLLTAGLSGVTSNAGTCAGTNLTLGTVSGTLPTLAPGASDSLSTSVSLVNDAANACQGVTFSLTASVSGESAAG